MECNYIIMKNEKSKLLPNLTTHNSIVINIGVESNIVINNLVGITFLKYDSMKEFVESLFKIEKDSFNQSLNEYLKSRDKVIFYTNESKKSNLEYIKLITELVGVDKCVFMFNREKDEY